MVSPAPFCDFIIVLFNNLLIYLLLIVSDYKLAYLLTSYSKCHHDSINWIVTKRILPKLKGKELN